MKPVLSVIIPAYNEEENFKKGALDKVADYFKKSSFLYEVIVVDDGSIDKTAMLVADFIKNKENWRLIKNPHQGKAATVRKGVEEAEGENVLFTDFDQATPISEVEKLLPFLNKGYSVVIGSREIKGAKREKEPFYRHLMGKIFNLVVKIIAFGGVADTQCGFKLFKTEVAKELFSQLKVYQSRKIESAFTGAFDVELLFLAQKQGFQIAEVPVHWRHFETERVNPIKDSVRMFFDVLKIRINDLLGKYDF
jgi:glycosyltransferase involved in cell wall biosynthesis